MDSEKTENQILTLENRSRFSVGLVENIESFSGEEIILKTGTGNLQITGAGLKLEDLSTENGNALITGRIDMMRFYKVREKHGFLLGFFK